EAAVQPDEPGLHAVQPAEPGAIAVQPVEPVAAAVQPAEPAGVQDTRAAGAGMDATADRSSRQRDSADPLTAELSRLHITVSKRFLDKLEAARAVLSHAQDGRSAESILEAGLDLVLKRHAARRGLVEKPRPGRAERDASETARGIPASVRREVWKRDGGRCQWPLDSGGICQSIERVEYDHIIPRAMGGSSRPGNLRLLCRFHNDLAARRAFGAEWMNQFTRDPAGGRGRPGS
ncbi:MAG: HNH endonuclease, partial [Deltaproteobacteria bacterium]